MIAHRTSRTATEKRPPVLPRRSNKMRFLSILPLKSQSIILTTLIMKRCSQLGAGMRFAARLVKDLAVRRVVSATVQDPGVSLAGGAGLVGGDRWSAVGDGRVGRAGGRVEGWSRGDQTGAGQSRLTGTGCGGVAWPAARTVGRSTRSGGQRGARGKAGFAGGEWGAAGSG